MKWTLGLMALVFAISVNAEQVTVLNKDGSLTKTEATVITSAAAAAQYQGTGQKLATPQANLSYQAPACVQSIETTYVGFDYSESWQVFRCRDYSTGSEYVSTSRLAGGTAIWIVTGQIPVFDANGFYLMTCYTAAGHWVLSSYPQFVIVPNGQVKSTYCNGTTGKG